MSAPVCTASAPVVVGKVCAWCRPGVNATEGHGICPTCSVRALADIGLSLPQRRDITAATQSPKETK